MIDMVQSSSFTATKTRPEEMDLEVEENSPSSLIVPFVHNLAYWANTFVLYRIGIVNNQYLGRNPSFELSSLTQDMSSD